MTRPMQIASGISVLFTTLGFGHIVFHNTIHMVQRDHATHLFVALHSIVALVVAVLSLIGAYALLRGPRQQNPQ